MEDKKREGICVIGCSDLDDKEEKKKARKERKKG